MLLEMRAGAYPISRHTSGRCVFRSRASLSSASRSKKVSSAKIKSEETIAIACGVYAYLRARRPHHSLFLSGAKGLELESLPNVVQPFVVFNI